MKTLNKILLALATSSVVMTGANAALYNSTYDNGTATHHILGYAGQPYVGLKAGQFTTDLPNDDVVSNDKPTAYGIYGGYQFDRNWAAEIEYVGSDKADATYNGTKVGDIKAQTYGAYGVYRYGFPNTNVYGKAKLGVAHNELKFDTDSSSEKENKTSVAGGLGLGYNVSPQVAIEAEYAFLPKVADTKSDLWTIGAHMKF